MKREGTVYSREQLHVKIDMLADEIASLRRKAGKLYGEILDIEGRVEKKQDQLDKLKEEL